MSTLTKEYLDQKFENLQTFLGQHMVTKAELNEMRTDLADKSDISRLYNVIDAFIKETRTYHQEMQVLRYQVQTMQEWIQQVAAKIGVEYRP